MQGCKKVVSIQDISGLGRCSLTVVIPVLSAMGIQVCPVPTAVLSAHTGYSEFVMRDLTDFMKPALEHYKKMDMKFDCVYSGFLASSEQIDHCLEFFEAFPDALKVVDPVMGDGGKAYKTYTKELCSRMVELVKVADIITPNLTEAAILLGEEYPTASMRSSEIKSWLVRLSKQGAKIVVITSVNLADGGMSTVGYDKENNSFWKIKNDYVPAHYSGTGDMFTSVLIGGLRGVCSAYRNEQSHSVHRAYCQDYIQLPDPMDRRSYAGGSASLAYKLSGKLRSYEFVIFGSVNER